MSLPRTDEESGRPTTKGRSTSDVTAAVVQPNAVALDHVTVTFDAENATGGTTVLDDLSLTVRPGELLVVVGKSGCGKTTVLNLLAGLVEPTGGTVTLLGESPRRAQNKVAYMFARDALLPWRTAIRNVEFALELRRPRLSRKDRRRAAADYLDVVGLGHCHNLYPWQLSQGMRQRVALARTWAIDPALLLMDEPFAALDAQTRADVQTEFLEIWASQRKSVLFVTHDLTEAILLADRIVLVDHGRIAAEHDVDIPRPRSAESIALDDRFRSIYAHLVGALGGPHGPIQENRA